MNRSTWRSFLGLMLPALVGAPVFAADKPAVSHQEKLPPGYVQGDVVSHSYVPIRTYSPKEGIGILPYLFEYYLMKWSGDQPLESYHDENIRRIDIASQWSTAICFYARKAEWRDELINLMIRCFKHRQLIVFRDYYQLPGKKNEGQQGPQYQNLRDILEKLWENRNKTLVSPEGDEATGLQLINNILACKLGDEGECGLKTEGLSKCFDDFDRNIRHCRKGRRLPFEHIKGWYNMLAYSGFCYAACKEDIQEHKRVLLPSNTQAIGVDVYHYWFHRFSPFDPADLSIPREKVRAHSDEWQRIRTKYYSKGIKVRAGKDLKDPKNWTPESYSDTHALMNAIELAGAKNAMMWYIGVSGQLGPAGDETTYTTPIETMESYYDHLKAGPWVALSWWIFDERVGNTQGGLAYYDKTLVHYTPEHLEGIPYSQEMLDYWHNEYVAMKMRMFNDVVYNQFKHLNGSVPALKKGECLGQGAFRR